MAVTASMVKELRESTGAGMMDAKTALTETGGDMEKAVDWLRTKGLAKAAKKAGVPVIVACEVIKLAPEDPRSPGEDRFDLTSPEHIDLFVTEEGEFPPLDIAALIDRTPFLHDGYQLLLAD